MKLHKWHPENGQHIHGFHSPKTPLRKISAMIGNERIFSRKSCSKVNSYSQIHFSSMVSTWIFDNKPTNQPTNQTTKRPNHETTKPNNQPTRENPPAKIFPTGLRCAYLEPCYGWSFSNSKHGEFFFLTWRVVECCKTATNIQRF